MASLACTFQMKCAHGKDYGASLLGDKGAAVPCKEWLSGELQYWYNTDQSSLQQRATSREGKGRGRQGKASKKRYRLCMMLSKRITSRWPVRGPPNTKQLGFALRSRNHLAKL